MKKAFWDSLQEKLSSQPPDYSHALVLIEEVREVRIITVINFNSVMTWRTYCLVNQPSLVRILSKENIFTCQLDGLKCFALGYCHPPVTLDYENLLLFRTNLCIPGKIYRLILSLVRLLQFIYLCWIKNFLSMSSQGGDRCYFVTNYKKNADESLCS